jgi:hypothetical protein
VPFGAPKKLPDQPRFQKALGGITHEQKVYVCNPRAYLTLVSNRWFGTYINRSGMKPLNYKLLNSAGALM